jgi:hypothetical protein
MKGLKIVLWICAVCCLLGFVAAALPWAVIVACFEWFDLKPPPTEPVMTYMLRVSVATFGFIGIFFVLLARNPLKYGGMLPLAAYGLLCFGVFCLVGGIRYGLPAWAYSGDVAFGLVAGILILTFRKKALEP